LIEIPIFRPEIIVYHRDRDGFWVSSNGLLTHTLFYPMDDFDGPTEAGFKKLVGKGSLPFHLILAPDDCEMVHRGRAVYLRTPDGKLHDATNAVILAKRREHGQVLARPGAPRPPSVRRSEAVLPSGRNTHMSMFGEGGTP
jgi:hypothetical protein